MSASSSLEVSVLGEPHPARPTLVFLHEGLGSVSMWRDFPARTARLCALPAIVYSRRGYGRSPRFEMPLKPDFMHRAAHEELPALLADLAIGPTILIGHSDGGSIALLRAAQQPAGLLGVVAMAPHLFVEPICTASITALAQDWSPTSRLARSLARHHADGERTFQTWSRAWLDPRFASWNIEREVASIRCPVLAIQGHDDQYGTMRQIERIHELAPTSELLALDGCGHSPHVDQPTTVMARIAAFVARLPSTISLRNIR